MFNIIKKYSIKLGFVFTLLMSGFLVWPSISYAQRRPRPQKKSHKTSYAKTKGIVQKLPADTTVVTTHKLTINGETIHYKAYTGTLPVYDENGGKPIASVFYVYYKRTGVENEGARPILFSFNGGPGSASLWMHIGYASPVRVNLSENGFPVRPFGVVPNHHSVLDVTDIVYLDPVNTGYSRILNNGKPEDFFGVNADIDYLARWINQFVTHYGRWKSPKFIIGESYGTTRAPGLAGALQGRYGMYLNGIILVANCGMSVPGTVEGPRSPYTNVFRIPTYAATAWYYKKLSPKLQNMKLSNLVSKVSQFTLNKVMPARTHGGSISKAKKQSLAAQIARYIGLSKQFVLNYNLVVPPGPFWKELLRGEGYTIGRLDTRYRGINAVNGGSYPRYSAEMGAWSHAFIPAFVSYLRNGLNFKTNLQFYTGGHVGHKWPSDRNHVTEMLRRAMEMNPALHVLDQQGYFDSACTLLAAKYSLWQLNRGSNLGDRINMILYKSGHMMYVRKPVMIKATNDLRNFIVNSIPPKGKPIKYNVNHVNLGGTGSK